MNQNDMNNWNNNGQDNMGYNPNNMGYNPNNMGYNSNNMMYNPNNMNTGSNQMNTGNNKGGKAGIIVAVSILIALGCGLFFLLNNNDSSFSDKKETTTKDDKNKNDLNNTKDDGSASVSFKNLEIKEFAKFKDKYGSDVYVLSVKNNSKKMLQYEFTIDLFGLNNKKFDDDKFYGMCLEPGVTRYEVVDNLDVYSNGNKDFTYKINNDDATVQLDTCNSDNIKKLNTSFSKNASDDGVIVLKNDSKVELIVSGFVFYLKDGKIVDYVFVHTDVASGAEKNYSLYDKYFDDYDKKEFYINDIYE